MVLGGCVEAALTLGALGTLVPVAVCLHVRSWRHKQSSDVTKLAEMMKTDTHSEATAQNSRIAGNVDLPASQTSQHLPSLRRNCSLFSQAAFTMINRNPSLVRVFVKISKLKTTNSVNCMKSRLELPLDASGHRSLAFSCSLLLLSVGSSDYMHVSPPCPAFPTSLVLSDPTQWKTPQNIFFCCCRFKSVPLRLAVCVRSM